jgi:hypothetical protein
MEKLICDKCGFELTDKEAIMMAFEGMEAWQQAQIDRGCEPRGIFPCKYYFQCKGEMQLVKGSRSKKPQEK